MTTPLVTVKVEPQEMLVRRHSRGDNLVINEGCRQPSPPRGHLRLVRPKKEKEPPTAPVAVKQEHVEMAAGMDTGLKWSRDDYVREEMKRRRRALVEVAARRHRPRRQ
ncbi:hypothetical protein D1007_31849 [Hordeum vulgare]|nr:hypothetical protein D1007_31849 [Hordeum vulgare]